MRVILAPGDLICDAAGLEPNSDHRVIFRMFRNTLIYGALSSVIVVAVMA